MMCMCSKILRMAAGWIAAAILLSFTVRASAPLISANSASLMDAASGRVLFEKSCDTRSLIASTTKIMTALLVIEDCDLQAHVSVPKEAVSIEGSSLNLREGQVISVEELLYGLMLHSGNDAASSLALYHSGSIPAFAGKMNDKARDLGLNGTHFENPHGLDHENHYSTARDLAVLTACALDNPVFLQIVSTKNATIDNRNYTNHNKLLWMYPDAIGVKTGYTKAAGRILVSAAQRDDRRLIAVTICDKNDWQDHISMLNYGFDHYRSYILAQSGQSMGSVSVLLGAEKAVAVVRERIILPVATGESIQIRVDLPPVVFAPVMAGDRAGSIVVLLNGVPIGEYPLFWRNCVFEEM